MAHAKRFVAAIVVAAALYAAPGCAHAQQPVTRAQAISAALERGARLFLGRAAAVHAARLSPNPSVSASWSQDVPHNHVLAGLPLDLPWLRSARIGAAVS